MEYNFKIVGNIQPKQRPRFKKCGRFMTAYTPKETLDYQELCGEAWRTTFMDVEPLDGALIVEMDAFFCVPKSLSKKKKSELRGKPNMQHNGDVDNIAKSVLDGLNKIAYLDDTQIFDLHVRKYYAVDDIEKIIVKIKTMEE